MKHTKKYKGKLDRKEQKKAYERARGKAKELLKKRYKREYNKLLKYAYNQERNKYLKGLKGEKTKMEKEKFKQFKKDLKKFQKNLIKEEIENLENAGYIFKAGESKFLFLDWEFENLVIKPNSNKTERRKNGRNNTR